MKNRETEAARRYHEATKHSFHSLRSVPHFLDWENQPRPFKIYRDLAPLPLPQERAPVGVSALDALKADSPSGAVAPDREKLASLLFLSAGITRKKSYPGGELLFRAASCTGALYHIELYVACAHLPDLEAGVYHFGPRDFALRRLRAGDWRGTLLEASGGEPSIVDAPAIAIFTSTFWRNAWKYRARAYRHAFWDSGTILANLLAAASAIGMPARIVLGFADEPVNRLLDVDPGREAALGLIALGRGGPRPPDLPGDLSPLGLATEPLSAMEVDYPEIREMHRASFLESGEEARRWRTPAPERSIPEPSGELVPLDPPGSEHEPTDGLETVVRRRGSSRRFARTPIEVSQLSSVLRATTGGISGDWLGEEGAPSVDLYLIVNAVDGLSPGAYFYHPVRRSLERLKEGDFRSEAGYLDLEQELAADASVNVYAMADLDPILERLGNRGYRAAQLEGGIIGGRVYLAAYAHRLGATGLTFYDDDVTGFFSPHAAGKSVLFLTAAGRPAKRRVLYEI